MSETYEYTDHAGRMFRTAPNTRGEVSVQNIGREGDAVTISITREDAPAIALAILRAAGFTANSVSDDTAQRAVSYLAVHEQDRAQKAEREAEDAKVREFMEDILPVTRRGKDWSVSDHDRTVYRKARDFFRESP